MNKKNLEQEVEMLMETIERSAEKFATDADGHMDLNLYLGYKQGMQRGILAALETFAEMSQVNKPTGH